MARTLVLALAMVLLGHGVAFAQILELEGRYWIPDVRASAKVNDSIQGTDIKFEDDLKLEAEPVPEIRLSIATGLFSRFRMAYSHTLMEGDETLGSTINFGDTTFPISTRVATEFEMHYARVGWLWKPPVIPGWLRLGPIFELKGFLADIELESRGVTPQLSESATIPLIVPAVGGGIDLSVFRSLHVFAEATGIYAGDYGHLLDAEAGLRLVLFRYFTLAAGYRHFDVRVGTGDDDDDESGELRLFGPYVSASIRLKF